LPKNERSAALVTLHDLFPTLCELSGIEIPSTVTGKSLAPLLRHQTDRIHDFVTGIFTDTQRMICDERWKFVLYPKANREQLFDLQNDPQELHDLSTDPAQQAKQEELRIKLEAWRQANEPR
jgi:arylsulfatase A-like enzyme